MPKKEKSVILRSLGALGGVELELDLDLPEIDPTALSEEGLEAQAEPVRKKIAEIEGWMPSALQFLQRCRGLSDEAQEEQEERVSKINETLESIFSHPKKALRRRGWLLYFSFQFAQDLKSQGEVEALLKNLVLVGLLSEAEEETSETLRAYAQIYVVPPKAGFRLIETVEVRKLLRNLTHRADDAETKQDLSLEEYRVGKPGSITLGVPPEKGQDDEGNTFWYPGCQLRMVSDGQMTRPIRVVANSDKHRRSLEQAISMKAVLPLASLDEKKPPFVRVPRGQVPEYVRKVHLIWHLHKRAERAQAEKKRLKLLNQEMASELVTVSPEEFFLEGKSGITKVELSEPWEEMDRGGKVTNVIYDVFFFPERVTQEDEEEDVKSFIRLTPERIPPHIQPYLSSCVGDFPEREKLGGIAYPLGAMLQVAWGQAFKSAQIINGGNSNS